MKNASEWAAIACVACLDIGLAISLVGGVRDGQRALGAAVTILVVHGACTGVATWWSWRVRSAVRSDVRARASEAGRTLAAGWLVLAVLAVSGSTFGRDVSALRMKDSAAVSILVVGAIVLVMGAGYTKYAEAIQVLGSTPAEEPQQRKTAELTSGAPHGLTTTLLILAVMTRVIVRSRRG